MPAYTDYEIGRVIQAVDDMYDRDYQVPFRFTGKLDKLTVNLKPAPMSAEHQRIRALTVGSLIPPGFGRCPRIRA